MTATDVGLPPGARRVQELLRTLGFDHRVTICPESTRTSAEAAAAVGCDVAQIAKSLIFRGRSSGTPVLVVASGANRVDEKAVARALADRLGGDRIKRADPDFVRASTGYVIGGVPPVGHAVPPVVAIDRGLLDHEFIWAAAGTPNAVFRLTPRDLVRMTGGLVSDIAKPGAKAG